jgi:hypothetical protein
LCALLPVFENRSLIRKKTSITAAQAMPIMIDEYPGNSDLAIFLKTANNIKETINQIEYEKIFIIFSLYLKVIPKNCIFPLKNDGVWIFGKLISIYHMFIRDKI